MRVCFFGDSFTNGTGDDDGLGWVGRILASARQAGRDLTAYNLGIRGNTSADIAARWLGEAKLRLLPEHDGRLVFSFGANDCASNGVDGGPRLARETSIGITKEILQAARIWVPTLMIGPATVVDDDKANERICALSDDYAKLCERDGIPYLDISRLTLASALWRKEALAGDGAHPNRGGYALVANAMVRWPAWSAWVNER